MAKSPHPSLADAIKAAVPAKPRRMSPWYEALPANVLAELEEVRAAFWRGEMGPSKYGVARAISAELRSRQISEVGFQGVLAWLQRGKNSQPR